MNMRPSRKARNRFKIELTFLCRSVPRQQDAVAQGAHGCNQLPERCLTLSATWPTSRVYLRSANEGLYLNFNGAVLSAGTVLNIFVAWTEENSNT